MKIAEANLIRLWSYLQFISASPVGLMKTFICVFLQDVMIICLVSLSFGRIYLIV